MPIDDALLAIDEPETSDLVIRRGDDKRFRYQWQVKDTNGAIIRTCSLTGLQVKVQGRSDIEATGTLFDLNLTVSGDGTYAEGMLDRLDTAALTPDLGSGGVFGRRIKIGYYDVQLFDSATDLVLTPLSGDLYLWRDTARP